MTVALSGPRALSHQLLTRTCLFSTPRTALYCNPLTRVNGRDNATSLGPAPYHNFLNHLTPRIHAHSYATRPGRPKAHTGRATASTKKTPTPKATTATKDPKKPAATKTKPKAAVKRKTKPKAPAAKPKRTRKPLTEAQKLSRDKKLAFKKTTDLRNAALLKHPKKLPETVFQILVVDASAPGVRAGENAKEASLKYKNLTPEETERLNHTANENKAKNDVAYKKWISTFTPTEIQAANRARAHLARDAKKAGKKNRYYRLQDERLVKRPANSYSYFVQDRYASGDMKHMRIREVGGLIAKEWKSLTAAEKQKFETMAESDRRRYNDEYKTVYGVDPPTAELKKSS